MSVNLKKARKIFGIDEKALNTRLLNPVRYAKEDKAKYKVLGAGTVQMDLQFWNVDRGYRYLLVAVDIFSKRIDLEALKDKEQKTIIDAVETIFTRSYIYDKDGQYHVLPNVIVTDPGTEFGKSFIDWCSTHNIVKRTPRVARKQQTAVVEGFNYVISRILAIRTTNDQYNAKKRNRVEQRQWVRYLPKLREVLNDKDVNEVLISKFFKFAETKPSQLLRIGDKVHVALEKPHDVNQNKLTGKFRTGDYRYEQEPREILNRIYNLSGNPVRYVVSGYPNVTFARSE